MNAKLTLSMDKRAIEAGKRAAVRSGTSVSKLVERYLLLLDSQCGVEDMVPVSSGLQQLIGIGAGSCDETDYHEHVLQKQA